MYAIVKTGGKQYRVQEGQSLLIERLPVEDGAEVALVPLLYVDGTDVIDGAAIGDVSVQAKVLAHERGPKLRIVKFKPKRGYKRRNGHRQELTRIEVTSISAKGSSAKKPAKAAKAPAPVAAPASAPAAGEPAETSTPEATDGA
jgi:large subunit ribosomal protein L21